MKRRITLERSYDARLDEVWELWTTKDGLEAWWGPDGFAVTVQKLELRPDGELRYDMTAVDPGTVQFMKQNGMPLTQHVKARYSEVVPKTRLAYVTLADFVPGVKPYDVETTVEFRETAGRVGMLLTFDAMHDDEWSRRARLGHESQLTRLDRLLANRTPGPALSGP